MTGIIKTDQLQGAQSSTITIPTGNKISIADSATVGTLNATTVDIAGDTSTLTLEDTSSHSANTGPAISFKSKDSGGTTREVAKIVGESHSGSNEGNLAFQTRNGGTLETKWKVFKNGNWLPSNSAYGIYLGTTSVADSNLLHDYEEGTFTAQISTDSTYTGETQSGVYTKIGDICFFQIRFQKSGTLNSGSNARFSLPFTSANNGVQASGFRGSVENIDTSMIGIGGTIAANNTILYLNEMTAATTGHNVNGNDLGANFQVQIQGFYKTA